MARRGLKEPELTLADIQERLRGYLPELRERYHIASLGVFGSYARGEPRKGSDLDILVQFSRAPTFFQFVRLEADIGKIVGKKVDLVMKDALKPSVRPCVLAEVIYIEG